MRLFHALTTLAVLVALATASLDFPVKHVIVLQLENRSFDHMCGYLKRVNPEIDGLFGNETNPYNTSDSHSPRVTVNPFSPYVEPHGYDPSHSVPATFEQVFGGDARVSPAPMDGFVMQAEGSDKGMGPYTMSCFNESSVPVISTLAEEGVIFDRWFASVPGPTMVNRMYTLSATSHGATTNDVPRILLGYPQQPLFLNVGAAGKTWKNYFQLIPASLILSKLRTLEHLTHNFATFDQFLWDAGNGTLPDFAMIDPRFYPWFGEAPTDQHPAHSVAEGERLIKTVYEALRASPQWNDTLFIVTYDEHGGFFDHVPTPLDGVPNPDGLNGTNPAFGFDRLGVRIPTIMVSPWINKNTVEHSAKGPYATSEYDHTSLAATLKKVWNMTDFLTRRDAWAGTFEHVLQERSTPRTDLPMTLPDVPAMEPAMLRKLQKQPPSDLQLELAQVAAALNGNAADLGRLSVDLKSAIDAAIYVDKQMKTFMARIKGE